MKRAEAVGLAALKRSAKMSLFVDKVQPSFPALLVCEDGSVGALYDLSCWTDDVDRWFWSSAAEYLIDVHGVTFIQDGERANAVSYTHLTLPTTPYV